MNQVVHTPVSRPRAATNQPPHKTGHRTNMASVVLVNHFFPCRCLPACLRLALFYKFLHYGPLWQYRKHRLNGLPAPHLNYFVCNARWSLPAFNGAGNQPWLARLPFDWVVPETVWCLPYLPRYLKESSSARNIVSGS